MPLEQNKEMVREAVAIWSTGDFSRVLEICAPDYVMHQHHDTATGGTGDLCSCPVVVRTAVACPRTVRASKRDGTG